VKLGFSNIRDTIEGSVGYVSRIIAGADRVRDALLFLPPGFFHRPMDEDTTTGTTDCVHVEDGSERIILATNNSSAWERILDALGRALDRGETVLTAEDGTGRAYVSIRPAGTLVISSDSGGGNTITITADDTTGDLTIATSGDVILDTVGVVKIGDAVAPEYAVMYNALKTDFDALVLAHNTHNHPTAPPGVVSGPSVPGVNLTAGPRSAKARISS